MSTFELKAAKDGKFYFNLTGAPPLAVLLSSDKFATKDEALHAIERVKRNAAVDERYEKKTSSASRHFFTLNGDDNQLIGTSSRFQTESDCDAAMRAVKLAAPEAAVSDLSEA